MLYIWMLAQEGRLLVGFMRINAKRFSEAYVPVLGVPVDIFIEGDVSRNRYVANMP
jgi:hypothetical protein